MWQWECMEVSPMKMTISQLYLSCSRPPSRDVRLVAWLVCWLAGFSLREQGIWLSPEFLNISWTFSGQYLINIWTISEQYLDNICGGFSDFVRLASRRAEQLAFSTLIHLSGFHSQPNPFFKSLKICQRICAQLTWTNPCCVCIFILFWSTFAHFAHVGNNQYLDCTDPCVEDYWSSCFEIGWQHSSL